MQSGMGRWALLAMVLLGVHQVHGASMRKVLGAGCSVTSVTVVGVQDDVEESFGEAVDEAFAVTSDCGTALAEAKAKVTVKAKAVARAFVKTSVVSEGSGCTGDSGGTAEGKAEGWVTAIAKAVANAVAKASANDKEATSVASSKSVEEKVERVRVKARSEVRGTGTALNSAVAEVVAETIAEVVAEAVVASKGCGKSGSSKPSPSPQPTPSPPKKSLPPSPPKQKSPTAARTRSISSPCDCAEDGVSGGVSTGRPGCAQHLKGTGDDGWFCYVVGGSECARGEESTQHPGAFWVDCN